MEKHLPSHFEVLSHNATTASVVVEPTLQISETLTGGINSILSIKTPLIGCFDYGSREHRPNLQKVFSIHGDQGDCKKPQHLIHITFIWQNYSLTS